MTELKPLQPLNGGNVLIVGVKASNFDDEIKNNPRVILWESQNKSWQGKDLPVNVRAVFMTRFIGHRDFGNIMAEARKKQITVFNGVEGTGTIARQVRELLEIRRPEPVVAAPEPPPEKPKKSIGKRGKLKVLIPFIDFNKTNVENAHRLLDRLPEYGMDSTLDSLANFVGVERQKLKGPVESKSKLDVSVEILDEMIKGLRDMRDFLVATTKENASLKARLDKFKKFLEE